MINILIAGDFCPNTRVKELIDKKNFEEVFNNVLPIVRASDYSILNLEFTIVVENDTNPIDKCGPNLKHKPDVLESVKFAKFDCVTLANNHFSDYGDKGVLDTISTLQNNEIDYVGGGINIEKAKRILYKTINSKKIAILNFCENEFTVASNNNGGANPLNIISNYKQINEAKLNSDFVIVITHGGHEHYQLPSPRMIETYRFFIDAGADAIINHHQHCYSGYEIYNEKPIFYGIGNFSFDWDKKRNTLWNEGFLVQLSLESKKIDFKIIPYIQGNDEPGVVLMNESQKSIFFDNINKLNNIIANPIELKNHFIAFVHKTNNDYISIYNPYQSRYFKKLQRHKLLPKFLQKEFLPNYWSKDRNLNLISFMQCESHIERCLESLRYHFNSKVK